MTVSIEQGAALLTALGLGGVAVKLLEIWANRGSEERRVPADLTRAAAEFQEALTDGGKELIDEFRKEFKFLRGRVADLQKLADDAKREAEEARRTAEASKAEHARCQVELTALRLQIETLLSERPPPPYDTLTRPLG